MASNLSNKVIETANKNFYGILYSFKINLLRKFVIYTTQKKIRLKNIIWAMIREVYIFVFKKKLSNSNKIYNYYLAPVDVNELSNSFNKNGFAYCENFLEKNCHDALVNNWPNSLFFKFPNEPIKNYYFGFREKFTLGYIGPETRLLKYAYYLDNFYRFLKSDQMQDFVNSILNSKSYKCISITSSIIKKNSFLAPHTDSIGENYDTINFVFFIAGSNDPEFSGGTGIYADNEFLKKIFIPKTINNSFIIYNSSIKFFHGFKKVKKGRFRFAITAQYSGNY